MRRDLRAARLGLLWSAAAGLVPVIAGVIWVGESSYRSIQQNPPGLATSLTSAVLQFLVQLAGAVCLGWWTWIGLVRPRRGPSRMVFRSSAELAPAALAATAWAVLAGTLVLVDGVDALGFPLSRLAEPGTISYVATANYLPMAWMFVAVAAAVLVAVALLSTRLSAIVSAYVLGLAAFLAPKLVTHLTVGPDHDLGTDFGIFAETALVLLVGLALAIAADRRPLREQDRVVVAGRLRRAVPVLLVVTVLGQAGVAWFELAGTAGWVSRTGALFVALLILCVVLAALLLARGLPGLPRRAAVVGLAGCVIAVTVVQERIPPPHYFAPTSITQIFLGFDVSRPPDWAAYLSAWRINVFFLVIGVVAVALYLAGVRVLRARGDHWPVGRTVAWVIGWLVVVVATSSGVGRYASASFSVHMALHMTLNMLGPLILVLGGPLTLALRALPARRKDEPAGPREWLTAAMGSVPFRAHMHPLVIFVLFVGSYYVFYFSPLFEGSLRLHWGHQLAYLDFLIVGYAYYDTVIGVDQPPRPVPHLAKLGIVLAAMPFHAFFGVALMSREGVIAERFYEYLGMPWMTDLSQDQYIGGGIAWAAGEFPLLIVVIALAVQWSRQDARTARRSDRRADRDGDQDLEAYNVMLEQLRSRSTSAGGGRS